MSKSWCWLQTSGKEKVKIDVADFKRVSRHSWRVTKGTTGRPRVVTSIRGPGGVRQITLGKFLMKPPKGKQVYPRRFNEGLDYRRSNLIVCTLKERQQLLPKRRRDATSVYRGVSLVRAKRQWRAAIEVNGKSINLGLFKTEAQAADAYNEAAREHFGKNAYQNQIGKKKNQRSE
jgi:hypothetical protein